MCHFLVKWLSHVYHLTSPLDGLNHVSTVFLVELLNAVITCDNESLMAERDGTSFGLTRTLVMVTPDLEIVTEASVIMIVEKDSFLTSISVEPLALWLEEDVGEVIPGISGLANPWGSPNP